MAIDMSEDDLGDGRLHMPHDERGQDLVIEVHEFIKDRIRFYNNAGPADNREVCNQCVMTIAAAVIVSQVGEDLDGDRIPRLLGTRIHLKNVITAIQSIFNTLSSVTLLKMMG